MKKLSVLMVLLTMASPLMAQTKKISSFAESGSGNGTLNRDILDYETQIDEADLQLETIDEAFDAIKVKLNSLAYQNNSEFNGSSEAFWTTLSEKDRKHLLEVDKIFVNVLGKQIICLDRAKETLIVEKKSLAALVKEEERYKARGLSKEFKKFIKERISSTQDSIRNSFFSLSGWLNYPLQDSLGIRKSFDGCEGAICLDLVYSKYIDYMDSALIISDTTVEMFGTKYRLTPIDTYKLGGYGKVKYLNFPKVIKSSKEYIIQEYAYRLNNLNLLEIKKSQKQ